MQEIKEREEKDKECNKRKKEKKQTKHACCSSTQWCMKRCAVLLFYVAELCCHHCHTSVVESHLSRWGWWRSWWYQSVPGSIVNQTELNRQRLSNNYLTRQTSLKNTSSGFKVGGRRVARCFSNRRMHTSTTFMGLQINKCMIIMSAVYTLWPSRVCK